MRGGMKLGRGEPSLAQGTEKEDKLEFVPSKVEDHHLCTEWEVYDPPGEREPREGEGDEEDGGYQYHEFRDDFWCS